MKTYRYIALVFMLMALGSCTRNDGDIGSLFGAWRLDQLLADGEPVELYEGDVALYDWRFQSHLIQIQAVYQHYSYDNFMGTWNKSDDDRILELTFDGDSDDGTGFYTPPAPLHLIEGGTTPLRILHLDGKDMKLEYTSASGVTYTYKLHKAY
ncbi:MAG: lipocalin-like domain-containing protein [Muribaculaceae bacterium]|nr:lipocalin-like domain-containing protein [Muribaculaceae bacterium]